MSEFGNYNKRDVALPPGCNDLMDVLQKMGHGASPVSWPLREFRTSARLLFSRFFPCTLAISTIDKRLSIALCREREQEVSAWVLVRSAKRENGIREFLKRHDIVLLHDHLMPAKAGERPVRSLKYSLAPLKASRLTTELLLTVCNYHYDSMMRFQYDLG